MIAHSSRRRFPLVPGVAAAALPLLVATSASAVTVPPQAQAQAKAKATSLVMVDGGHRLQRIDGFGISEAFGTANQIRYLGDTPARRRALDMLFDRTTGAGFDILRNLIPSGGTRTMEPTAPDSPNDPPTYVWDGTDDATDWGQLWLAKQARTYGVTTFYNDAWSAPGFMKTNNSEINGGMLCGTPGATCASGDWRQAYANYLVQHTKNWASVGLTPTALGFINEPTYTPGYSSMEVSPAQAADFAAVLGPTLRASGLRTRIACCDTVGWADLPDYAHAILADPAARRAITLFTSHGYSSAPTSAVDTGGRHVWQSEWSNGRGAFNTAWDDGSPQSGFTWAQHVLDGLTKANLNAFLYWWGISTSTNSNGALVRLDGTTLIPSKRYYALTNFSRFIRPGATRVGASSQDKALQVAAFRNPDGTVVVVALNTATTDSSLTYRLRGTGPIFGPVTPHLTNDTNSTAAGSPLPLSRGGFSATVPARSLVTYVVGRPHDCLHRVPFTR